MGVSIFYLSSRDIGTACFNAAVGAAGEGEVACRRELSGEELRAIDHFDIHFGSAWDLSADDGLDDVMEAASSTLWSSHFQPPITWENRIDWSDMERTETVLPVFPMEDRDRTNQRYRVTVQASCLTDNGVSITLVHGTNMENAFIVISRRMMVDIIDVEMAVMDADRECPLMRLDDEPWNTHSGGLHPTYEYLMGCMLDRLTPENAVNRTLTMLLWAEEVQSRQMGTHLGFTLGRCVDFWVNELRDANRIEWIRPLIDLFYRFRQEHGRDPRPSEVMSDFI